MKPAKAPGPCVAERTGTLPDTRDGSLTEAGRLTRNVLSQGQTDWTRPGRSDPTGASGSRTPADVDFRALGARLLRANRFAESISAFHQAIMVMPGDASLYHDLALAYAGCGRFGEAAESLRQAVTLKGDFASAHYHLGRMYEVLGADALAMDAYRRAVALTPRLAIAHERLGALLKRIERQAEAIESFERAAAIRPETTTTRVARAQAFALRGKARQAEKWFRRALVGDPHDRYVITEFGIFLSQQGRLGESADRLAAAVGASPDDAFAFFHLSGIKQFAEADRALLEGIAAQLGMIDEPVRLEVVHFGLGKGFDDLGDYATAMQHFDAGNRLAAARAPFDRKPMTRVADRVIAAFAPGMPDWQIAATAEDAAPLLIVGMPRSGTTLTEQIISSHPEVGAGGELTFWDERLRAMQLSETRVPSPKHLQAAAKEYCALLHGIAPGKARVTDKMPFNLMWLGPIHCALPNARFIHCRRHPVDTCLSLYMRRFATGTLYANDRADIVFVYRLYERVMAHWRAVLPPDRLLEVDYEDLVRNREAVTRRIVAFCGLAWDEACLAPERNQRVVDTASLWQVRQSVYDTAIGRWPNYEPWLGPLRELLDDDAA